MIMYPHHGVPLPGEGGGAVLHEVVHVSQGAGVVLVRRQDLPQLLVPALTRDLGGEQVKISGGCTKYLLCLPPRAWRRARW